MRAPIGRRNVYGRTTETDISTFKTLHELAEALKKDFTGNPRCGPGFDRDAALHQQGKVDLATTILARIDQITANPLTTDDLEDDDIVSENP